MTGKKQFELFRITMLCGLLFTSSLAMADGFGWYARLFDYEKFSADYEKKIARPVRKIDREFYGDTLYRGRGTDWAILEFLELHGKEYGEESPYVFSGELLWHEAMMENTDIVLHHRPNSAIRHLLTGRLFISPKRIISCKPERYGLIHGACRSCILFTNKEARAVYWDLTQVLRLTPNFRNEIYGLEFHRLRDIFKEAALKDKGLYIYGHD